MISHNVNIIKLQNIRKVTSALLNGSSGENIISSSKLPILESKSQINLLPAFSVGSNRFLGNNGNHSSDYTCHNPQSQINFFTAVETSNLITKNLL
jgi:hypothetical protein